MANCLTYIFCDKNIPQKLKGKVYRTVVRPVMTYAAETWAIKKTEAKMLETAEMRILRWSTGKTKLDKVRNEVTRAKMGVRSIAEKLQESRMRWYGHMIRRDEDYCGKFADAIKISGKRRRGRPEWTWYDNVKADHMFFGVTAEDALDRTK